MINFTVIINNFERINMKKRIYNEVSNIKAEKNRGRRVLIFLKNHIYTILYVSMLIVLWAYIIKNWEICISMQFFSQFNGNNILFITGLVLIILPFYDIEGKGIRLRRRSNKGLERKLQGADSKYDLDRLFEAAMQNSKIAESDGGDGE